MSETMHRAETPARPRPLAPRCHLPWQEMIVQADGSVEPCCYWTAHGNANPPLGNLNEHSIEEIWNNENYRRLRENMAKGRLKAAGCADCFAIKQGQKLGLEYDEACESPDYADTAYAENIRTLKAEVAAGATELKAKPTIVSVTPSHKCNLACLHCYQNSSRERQWTRRDAFEEVKALTPTLVRLIAGGGEPLLLQRWRRFISEFDPQGAPLLNFGMTTNATVLKKEVLDGLKKFKSLHVIVSMDGASSAVYDKIRVNGSFAQVERNIETLQQAVAERPGTSVTTFGLCMSVMKSNILHLPDFVRWAAAKGVVFSMHPVLTMPLTESLASFNDPEREMAGWRAALDETQRLIRTIDTPDLPELWRATQSLPVMQAGQAWPFLGALESFIPWDIGYTRHRRFEIALPQEALDAAAARWPKGDYVASFQPLHALSWKARTVPYHARVAAGSVSVSLPIGEAEIYLANAFDLGDFVFAGVVEVGTAGAALVRRRTRFAAELDRLLRRDDGAMLTMAAAAAAVEPAMPDLGLRP